MRKTTFILMFLANYAFSQVGIGTTTPNNSSALDVTSVISGVLIPRMTEAERIGISSPANGLLVYQTDSNNGFWYFNGTTWNPLANSGWNLNGNTGTNPTTNFLGTTDNNDFIIATNNTERIRLTSNGNIGINESNPTAKLHITGAAPLIRLQDGTEGIDKILKSDNYGNMSWQDKTFLSNPDDDWRFTTSNLNTFQDKLYRIGNFVVGRAGNSTHHLTIHNGAATGSTLAIGDVEYYEDGSNETMASHNVVPNTAGGPFVGSTTYRWRTLYSQNALTVTSDERFKSNIKPLNYGINTLLKFNPVSYYWKEENYLRHQIPDDKKELKLGLIAQEVLKIVPEVVPTFTWMQASEEDQNTYVKKENEYIGINYEDLVAILVKAKQEQQIQLEKLQNETKLLLNKVKTLKDMQ